jgi:hypothetical protein
MILALDFNNKNQYRRYPIKQQSSLTSTAGYVLEDAMIVNCSITSVYGKHRVYISQIYKKDSSVRIAISSVFDDTLLGIFTGDLSKDYSVLTLTSVDSHASGAITLGSLEAWQRAPQISFFKSAATELEESTIFCFEPPKVTSISDKKNQSLRGIVSYGVLTNIDKYSNTTAKQTNLESTSPASVSTIADKSSFLNNCETPVIKNINGVTPFPKDVTPDENDGNIYIVGVLPITFYGISLEEGVLTTVTEGMSIDSLCGLRSKLLPPVDISGFVGEGEEFKNKYYNKAAFTAIRPDGSPPYYNLQIPKRLAGNFNVATLPEYYYWPQFVRDEYYSAWFKYLTNVIV